MKKKILFFTGSRADYGILKPLIKEISKKNMHQLNLQQQDNIFPHLLVILINIFLRIK